MLKPKARKDLVFREEDEGGFLFNPDNGSVKVLNNVGAFIWQLLDGKKTTTQIIREVQGHFSHTSLKQAEADLNIFLAELKKSG